MTADILDRQSFIHIIFADVFFDQKDGRVFLRTVRGFSEKIIRLINQCLMQFFKSKTAVNCFCNRFRISGAGDLLLMACILQTQEKLIIQILYRILKEFKIVGKAVKKLL